MRGQLTVALVSIGSVAMALLLGAVMLLLLGADPISGYATMINAAFGSLDRFYRSRCKPIQ